MVLSSLTEINIIQLLFELFYMIADLAQAIWTFLNADLGDIVHTVLEWLPFGLENTITIFDGLKAYHLIGGTLLGVMVVWGLLT